ncbi:MAG: hypothetical protein Tsb0014_10930 [Pleurocapsa sp.]
MDDLFKAIACAEIEQKLDLLPQLLSAGTKGIDYLIESLGDRELAIRVKAYELLQNITSQEVQQAISPGILLQPGDKVYSVYRSGMWFTDQKYLLFDRRYLNENYLDELRHEIYGKRDDDDEEYTKCKRIFCYLKKEIAEQKAEALHRKIIQQEGLGIGGFEWCQENPDFNARQWCIEHNVSDELLQKIEYWFAEIEDKELADNFRRSKYIYHPEHIDTWCNDNNVKYDSYLDKWDRYKQVVDYLYLPENIALLSKFWKDGVGDFAFVKEEIVQETIYLKPGEKLGDSPKAEISKIQSSLKPENYSELASKFLINIIKSKYSSTEQKLKAQELLKKLNIDTKEAKKTIAKEITVDSIYDMRKVIEYNTSEQVLLQLGDKVYSVYQAGICYTDQDYLMNNEVDYLYDLEKIIYAWYEDEDPRRKTKRIYCYLEKGRAEAKAEAIHREMIHNNGIGIGVMGFEWCKENPDFDARQWRNQHNIPYPDIQPVHPSIVNFVAFWQIEEYLLDNENTYLLDNLRRSRYIYHPEHIDTWCNDNQVKYDPNLDNWNNYRQVLDYLYQPENIALLSKFWKDGVGHFAFVKEEILQETIYLKPGEKSRDRPEAEISKIQSSLKPENYPELASKFLINIIEGKHKSTEQKLKARELLQNIPGENLPF